MCEEPLAPPSLSQIEGLGGRVVNPGFTFCTEDTMAPLLLLGRASFIAYRKD